MPGTTECWVENEVDIDVTDRMLDKFVNVCERYGVSIKISAKDLNRIDITTYTMRREDFNLILLSDHAIFFIKNIRGSYRFTDIVLTMENSRWSQT